MKISYIVVENLRIGGSQRLALDEAYFLSEKGLNITIVTLSSLSSKVLDNFEIIEKNLIDKYNIKIVNAFGSKYDKFVFFRKLIKNQSESLLIVSHNLSATLLIRIARLGYSQYVKIITTIHQIPSLSSFTQRFKRYFYSLFSDKLFPYSFAVKKDWEERLRLKGLLWTMRNKDLSIIRNGVFLRRLPKVNMENAREQDLRFVYLGRQTGWKGIDVILKLAQEPLLEHARLLFIIPTKDITFLSDISGDVLKRITFQVGTAFDSYVPKFGDIHLYPTNYGPKAKYLESISINCLEMACVGIPSIVTKNGLGTWPEFKGSPLFIEVDWNNTQEVINSIINYKANDLILDEIDRIKNLVDIKLHVAKMIDAFK